MRIDRVWEAAALAWLLAAPLAAPAQESPAKPKPDARFGNVMFKTPDPSKWKRSEEAGRLLFSAAVPPPDFVTLTVFPGSRLTGDFRKQFDAAVAQELKRLGVVKVERDSGVKEGKAAEGFQVLQQILVCEAPQFHTCHWFLAGNPGNRFDMIGFQTSGEETYKLYGQDAGNFFYSVKLANSLQTAGHSGASAGGAAKPLGSSHTVAVHATAHGAPAAAHTPAAGGATVQQPAPSRFATGSPAGLFFMTRYWSYTSTLEKAAWYFSPDGRVYENLQYGFSPADLAAHTGPKGTYHLAGANLVVNWSDGKTTSSKIERDATGFAWDGGIFTPVRPFQSAAAAAGSYEGGESLVHGGNFLAVSKTLSLSADGTFTWEGVAFVQGTTDRSDLSGSSQSKTTGRWRLNGYSLILGDTGGKVFRGIAFPFELEAGKRPSMFFGGIMYKPR